MHGPSGDPMSTAGRHHEAGFTLIEVLISILLTVVAVVGIMGLYRVETRASGNTRHTTEASSLATDRIELLRTASPAGTAPPLPPIAGVEANITERGLAGGIYTRTSTVVAGVGYFDLVVVVSWNEEGVAKNVTARARRN